MANIEVRYHTPQQTMVWNDIPTDTPNSTSELNANFWRNTYYAQLLEYGGFGVKEETQIQNYLKVNGGSQTKSNVQQMISKIEVALHVRENRFYTWCGLDTHRWIAGLYVTWVASEGATKLTKKNSASFAQDVVEPIQNTHGNIFHTALYGDQNYYSLNDWHDAIATLTDAVLTNDYGTVFITSDEQFTTNVTTQTTPKGIDYQANNILGWCYILKLRDMWHGITYADCEGCSVTRKPDHFKREVPSLGLPTARFKDGRTVKNCGVYCSARIADYKRALKIVESGKVDG